MPRLGAVRLAERSLGKRHVDVALGQVRQRTALGGGEADAVDADLDLGDLRYTVRSAKLGFRSLHPARGVLDVREAFADAGAKQLHAGPVPVDSMTGVPS